LKEGEARNQENLKVPFVSLHSRQQHGRSETEEYSSESESESEDEEELQIILEDLQRQNEELEVSLGETDRNHGNF
jgi:RalA-binding protein 1